MCSQARKKETGRESEAVVASSHYRLLLLLEAVFGSCLKPIQAAAAGLRPSPRGLTKIKLSYKWERRKEGLRITGLVRRQSYESAMAIQNM